MTGSTRSSLLVQLQDPRHEWVDVGLLTHEDETTWFESFDSYWDRSDRPVLGQQFEERGPSWRPSSRVSVPKWFSHLLPEGPLREAIASSAGISPLREFFLLRRIGGDDLPGAVRVVEAAAADDGAVPSPDPEADYRGDDVAAYKFSLAGVQLKFSIVEEDRGLTIPARGRAGTWIAKLPDQRAGFGGVPRAEFAAMALARASGIDVPETRLVPVGDIQGLPDWALTGGGEALLVRRFDRTSDDHRVHVEQLAQIMDVSTGKSEFKYTSANFETVARFTAFLCGLDAIGPVIDRIVLNVMVGNGDAHTKNWAYLYPDGRNPALSPAFDIVPTVLYMGDDDLGMNLAGSKDFRSVSVSAFERLATKAGGEPGYGTSRARAAIARVRSAWPVLDGLLPPQEVQRLTERLEGLPLLS